MRQFCGSMFALGLLTAVFTSSAATIDGPVVNPSNGSTYYLLDNASWTDSELEAESLGGTLAIVNSAEENKWIYDTFSSLSGVTRNLWIGLYRKDSGSPFSWVSGEPVAYTNWASGEPNNTGGEEYYAEIWGYVEDIKQAPSVRQSSTWNDNRDSGNWPNGWTTQPFGVVEVSAVPEPASAALILAGLGIAVGAAHLARRRDFAQQ